MLFKYRLVNAPNVSFLIECVTWSPVPTTIDGELNVEEPATVKLLFIATSFVDPDISIDGVEFKVCLLSV